MTDKLAGLMARFGYPPDRLAQRVVEAIASDRDQLVLTPESVATNAMARLAPGALRGSMSSLFRLAARFGATEREGSP